MKVSEKTVSALMLLIAVLFVISLALCIMGYGFKAIYVSAAIVAIFFFLGLRQDGQVSKKLFFYPYLIWLISFYVGFIGMEYFDVLFGESMPSFLILGWHPSTFFEVACYWLCGLLTISLGIYIFRKEWLSDERWDKFLKFVEENEDE